MIFVSRFINSNFPRCMGLGGGGGEDEKGFGGRGIVSHGKGRKSSLIADPSAVLRVLFNE